MQNNADNNALKLGLLGLDVVRKKDKERSKPEKKERAALKK